MESKNAALTVGEDEMWVVRSWGECVSRAMGKGYLVNNKLLLEVNTVLVYWCRAN